MQGVQRLVRASRSADGSIRATLVSGLELELAGPQHMSGVAIMPGLGEPSSIITDEQVSAEMRIFGIHTVLMCHAGVITHVESHAGAGQEGRLNSTT